MTPEQANASDGQFNQVCREAQPGRELPSADLLNDARLEMLDAIEWIAKAAAHLRTAIEHMERDQEPQMVGLAKSEAANAAEALIYAREQLKSPRAKCEEFASF